MPTDPAAGGLAVRVSAEVSPVWLAVPIHSTVDPESWGAAVAADPPEPSPGADGARAGTALPDARTQAGELARLLRLLRRQADDVPLVTAWALGGRHDRLPRAVVPVLVMAGVSELEPAVGEVLRLPPPSVEPPAVATGTDLTGHRYARIRQVVLLGPPGRATPEEAARAREDRLAREVADTVVPVTDEVAGVGTGVGTGGGAPGSGPDPAAPRVTERFAACFPRPAAGLTVVATCLADDPVHAAAVEGPVWHLLDALEVRAEAAPSAGRTATVEG